jgi:hypothetical protein
VVKCNDLDQPIGKEAKHPGNFLGTIARNGSLCSLSYKDWRLLIGEKDRETNVRINLKAILDQVKVNCGTLVSFTRFSYFALNLVSLLFSDYYYVDEVPISFTIGTIYIKNN